MQVTALPKKGNSSKFHVFTKNSEFTVAISYTLRATIWKLEDEEAEFAAASLLAEAIVSRHDPKLPFKPLYIFAEHNSDPSLDVMLQQLRKHGYEG